MNDFTKEDLVILKNLTLKDIHWLREKSVCIELDKKIQSMIDSYCEHEFAGYIEGSASIPYCNKCCKAIL